MNFFRKVDEDNKRNMVEGFKDLQTFRVNKKGFRKLQYKRSLVARNICHMVGAPALRSLKMMISNNSFQNFSVTVEDIEIAENIFGPGVYTLKGRTAIQRPKVVVGGFI